MPTPVSAFKSTQERLQNSLSRQHSLSSGLRCSSLSSSAQYEAVSCGSAKKIWRERKECLRRSMVSIHWGRCSAREGRSLSVVSYRDHYNVEVAGGRWKHRRRGSWGCSFAGTASTTQIMDTVAEGWPAMKYGEWREGGSNAGAGYSAMVIKVGGVGSFRDCRCWDGVAVDVRAGGAAVTVNCWWWWYLPYSSMLRLEVETMAIDAGGDGSTVAVVNTGAVKKENKRKKTHLLDWHRYIWPGELFPRHCAELWVAVLVDTVTLVVMVVASVTLVAVFRQSHIAEKMKKKKIP